MTTLDIDAVKAFVVIANLKSFTRAAESLGTTQGAISVKLKRLENRIGKKTDRADAAAGALVGAGRRVP